MKGPLKLCTVNYSAEARRANFLDVGIYRVYHIEMDETKWLWGVEE